MVPAPVKVARAWCDANGLSYDVEALKGMPKEIYQKMQANYRNTMQPDAKARYRELKSDTERKDWLALYMIDPKTAVCKGYNSTVAFDQEENKGSEQWLSEEQMGGPMFLNSANHAGIIVKGKVLEERDHENPALAAAGVKQYYFSWSRINRSTGVRKEAGVRADAELTPEEYQETADQMAKQGLEPQVKKPKITHEKKVLSEEQKAEKTANVAKGAALRKLKAKLDKTLNDLDGYEQDAKKLPPKGFPQAITEFYLGKIQEQRNLYDPFQRVYAVEVVKS